MAAGSLYLCREIFPLSMQQDNLVQPNLALRNCLIRIKLVLRNRFLFIAKFNSTCKGSVLVLITAWPHTALQFSNRLRRHLLNRCKRGSSNTATAEICYLFNHFENFNLRTHKTSAVMMYTTVVRVSNFPVFCYCFALL